MCERTMVPNHTGMREVLREGRKKRRLNRVSVGTHPASQESLPTRLRARQTLGSNLGTQAGQPPISPCLPPSPLGCCKQVLDCFLLTCRTF